jgi:hypothetical protein
MINHLNNGTFNDKSEQEQVNNIEKGKRKIIILLVSSEGVVVSDMTLVAQFPFCVCGSKFSFFYACFLIQHIVC